MENESLLRFQIASEPALRSLYYALRGREYLRHWGVPGMEVPDSFDRSGEIVVALENNRVVGGGRLNVSRPEAPAPLPLEGDDLCLRAALPHIDWSNTIAAEFSRHTVDSTAPNQRGISTGLAAALFRLAASHGVALGFFISPEQVVRINRMHARRSGLLFHEFAVAIPARNGIAMRLCGYSGFSPALGPQS